MAKKKAPLKKTAEDDKARLQIRFDQAVYPKLQQVADDVGVSVNRIMNALAWFLVTKGRVNSEPIYDQQNPDFVDERDQPGIIWFGRTAQTRESDSSEGPVLELKKPGYVAGVLDFTERRVVRDE